MIVAGLDEGKSFYKKTFPMKLAVRFGINFIVNGEEEAKRARRAIKAKLSFCLYCPSCPFFVSPSILENKICAPSAWRRDTEKMIRNHFTEMIAD